MQDDKNFLVDMVYLWCDGTEPAFQSRKAQYMNVAELSTCDEAASNKRFCDNEELRYSLRSLEKNAPWIHHIFIVTDRQVPTWLNLDNSKVSIVDHSAILPKELIPTFNSSVIERYIGFIPGLQEHFLYGNDDTFFGKKVSKSFFFNEEKAISRVKKLEGIKTDLTQIELGDLWQTIDLFGKSVINAWQLLSKQYNLQTIDLLAPHHNIDAFIKSDYQNTFYKYQREFDQRCHKFRNSQDIQRILFSCDPVMNNRANLLEEPSYSVREKLKTLFTGESINSYYIEPKLKSLLVLLLLNPVLFCINDSGNSQFGNLLERWFLQWKYPKKSSFEK